MKALKGKIIVIMALATVLLGGLGYFSLKGLFELTDRISHLAEPTGKWRRFQKITTDLSKLNSIFVLQGIDSEKSLEEDYLSLIDSIKVNIDELKAIYKMEGSFDGQLKLDTIPIILEQIKDEFNQVNELRTRNQNEVYQKLEAELLRKLGEVSIKDSLLIVEKISYEVRKRNVPDSIFIPRGGEYGNKSTFIQRLFGKERTTPDELVIQHKEVIDDTLVVIQSDTLLLSSSDDFRDEEIALIIKDAFANYFRGEVQLMEKIRKAEQNFYTKNAGITAELETLINDLRYKETIRARHEAETTYEFSRRYQVTIIAVIAFFFLSSIVLVYFSLRDINRNRRFQQQIIQSEKKAIREARAKQDFLSTMSHELRTPLTSIIGFAEMLNPDDDNAKSIKSSSIHLLQVANEILDMAKVEAGIIDIQPESFDMTALLYDVKRSFQGLISDKGLTPRFELPDDPLWVESDPHRIRQVLYNLLHNALKFTEKGMVGLSSSIEYAGEEFITFTINVSDTGVGIDQAEQESIFDQYHQAGTHKNKMQGTGLGLGIVKKVIGLLGGEIRLKSAPGQGSVFTVVITVKRADPEAAKAADDADEAPSLSGVSIYCIDDDVLIVKLYQRIFSGVGAQVTCETRPDRALEHLRKAVGQYDVVITDIKMPKLTGYQLLQKLEEHHARPAIIVASTANVLRSEQDKDQLERFDAVFSKPLNRMAILRKITEMTGRNHLTGTQISGAHIADGHIASTPEPPSGSAQSRSATSGKVPYSLDDYRAFTMNDEDFLKEIVQDILRENEKDLARAFELLDQEEKIPLAEIIHKMSSRFAQLKVTSKSDAKQLELDLREGHGRILEARELLKRWKLVHKQMLADHGI